jgi:hypothetical protein
MLLLPLLWSASPAVAAPGRDQFEGKWNVTVTPDDGGKPYQDTLTFHVNKFVSEFGKKHGFAETDFEADTRGGQIATFTASAKSKTEGSAKWTGTAATGQMNGTMTWTKADGSTVSYSYMGTRAEK